MTLLHVVKIIYLCAPHNIMLSLLVQDVIADIEGAIKCGMMAVLVKTGQH